MSIIKKFEIFSEIDQHLVNNINLFYLTKSHLLFTTNEVQLFHYNINNKVLKKFESFCENQVIIKFDCSDGYYTHYMALTDNGCVYSWGDNSYGQLGDASVNDSDQPKLINNLSEHFITDISCGFGYSLVLTSDGGVHAFGSNYYGECGNNTTDNQLMPNKVEIPNTTKVIAISCGCHHSIVLTQCGHVFGWGSNIEKQLGIDGNGRQLIPIQLNVPLIMQIMCGEWYTLMLSIDGDIYFCGTIEDCVSHDYPTKLNSSTKFTEIAATINSELCVALSSDNKCYIFGNYGDNSNEVIIRDLQQTDFASINETFSFYEQITYKCIKIEKKYSNMFKELSLLSSGGFSSVFKCEHRLTQQLYAIKKISYEVHSKESVLNGLKFFSKLDSSFAVKYIDYWIEENYYLSSHSSEQNQNYHLLNPKFFIPKRTQLLHIQMELCSLTLRDAINIIKKECVITPNNTLSLIGYYISSELLYEILECVQYLHQQNPAIIHRDLKPENILLTQLDENNRRFVKLSDFGLSTFHEFSDQSHTVDIGFQKYRAYEVDYTTKYTTKADIFSLGRIILEMFLIDRNKENDESLLALNKIKDMAKLAVKLNADKRPDCSEMLSQHNEWRVTREQLLANEEFTEVVGKIPKSKSIDDNFIEYFVQNKFQFK